MTDPTHAAPQRPDDPARLDPPPYVPALPLDVLSDGVQTLAAAGYRVRIETCPTERNWPALWTASLRAVPADGELVDDPPPLAEAEAADLAALLTILLSEAGVAVDTAAHRPQRARRVELLAARIGEKAREHARITIETRDPECLPSEPLWTMTITEHRDPEDLIAMGSGSTFLVLFISTLVASGTPQPLVPLSE